MRAQVSFIVLSAALALAACSSQAGGGAPPAGQSPGGSGMQQQTQAAAAHTLSNAVDEASVIGPLDDEKTIGSVVDPVTGDVNPYGLDVAASTSGDIDAGDLVVCDFNDKANVQGTGTSLLAIHPTVGSMPRHILSDKRLRGCDALALAPDDTIWPADFIANDTPIVTSSGQFVTGLRSGPWHHPFGIAFSTSKTVPAFYVSNAGDGSLVRIGLSPSISFTVIATGFPINGGAPGSILGPSGLNYAPDKDRLYVVDGQNNALYAINNISTIPANGIVVNGLTFSGPAASNAHVIYAGAPLNGPISSAILPGGHIAVGNTLDPAGKNLIIEITLSGHVVSVRNVDTGAAGALFGMVATGTTPATTRLYFNDDNDNTLKVLAR